MLSEKYCVLVIDVVSRIISVPIHCRGVAEVKTFIASSQMRYMSPWISISQLTWHLSCMWGYPYGDGSAQTYVNLIKTTAITKRHFYKVFEEEFGLHIVCPMIGHLGHLVISPFPVTLCEPQMYDVSLDHFWAELICCYYSNQELCMTTYLMVNMVVYV